MKMKHYTVYNYDYKCVSLHVLSDMNLVEAYKNNTVFSETEKNVFLVII